MVFRVRLCFAAKLKEMKDIRKAKEEEKYRQELEQRLKREEAFREERERKEREKKELEEATERDRLERMKRYNEQKVLVKKEREELKKQAARDKKREINGTSKLTGITRNEESSTVRKTSLVAEYGVPYGLNGNGIDLKDLLGLVKMNDETEDVKEQSMNSGICSDKGNFTTSIYESNEEVHNALTKGVINGKTEQYASKEEYGQKLKDDLKVSKISMETQSLENIEIFKSRTGNDGKMHERIGLYRKERKSMGIHERESVDLRKNSSEENHESVIHESVIVKEDGNKEMSERESGDLGENRFECNKPEKETTENEVTENEKVKSVETTENEVTENEKVKSVEVGQAENSFQVVSKGEDLDTPDYDDNANVKVNHQFIDAFCGNDNANAGTDAITHNDDGHRASNNATHVDTVSDNDTPSGVSDDELLEFLCELYQEWKKTATEKR